MRLFRHAFPAFVIALIACTATGSEHAGPRLVIVSGAPEKSATTVSIVIENSQMPCPTFYVDRLFLPRRVSNRPETVLSISLRERSGKSLPLRQTVRGTYMKAGPEDVIRIDCGMVLGQVLDLSSDLWFGALPAGEYYVTATLNIGLGRFAAKHPEFVKSLAAISRKSEADTRDKMRDMVLTSEEVQIRVPVQP